MVSAELDTNNTGLFKLTMNLLSAVSTSTSATTATPRWCGNGNGTGKSNSLVACLAGQLLKSPTVPSVPRPSQGGVPSNDKASPVEFQELRSVSLVLKASETLQLVEWLTALMELRG